MASDKMLPTCGTCPFATDHETERETKWCHARPPQLTPLPPPQLGAVFPPVGTDKIGCSLHPDWPQSRREFRQ
jgi:hypothetical protein